MATQAAAALLDELMGRQRNILPSEKATKLHWDSPDVCRYYLVKFCPNDLFTNTKSDLGSCEKVHDDILKREFETANSYKRTSYEDEFIRYAESMLLEVDKRIKKGRQRLSLSLQDALANSTTGDGRVDEQIELLSEKITGLVNEAERLGSEGNVEEAQGLSKLCDKLREERDQLRKANENSVWHQAAEMAASQEKQMEVCEICGAFLIVGDAQQRIDDHLTGKQHVGFAKLRAAILEIKENRESARAEREQLRESERERRRKALADEEKRKERDRDDRRRHDDKRRRDDRDYDRRRDKDSRRDRNRDHDRHGRSRSRDRHRGSHHDRGRSRSSEYDRRDGRRQDDRFSRFRTDKEKNGSMAYDGNKKSRSKDRDRNADKETEKRKHKEQNGSLDED